MLLPSGPDTVREFSPHGTQFGSWSKDAYVLSPVGTAACTNRAWRNLQWRREWDSNPRAPCRATRFRGELFRPLRHLSAVYARSARKLRKKSLSIIPHSSARMPPVILVDDSRARSETARSWSQLRRLLDQSHRRRHAGSRASMMAPAHIGQGSSVTYSVQPSRRQPPSLRVASAKR